MDAYAYILGRCINFDLCRGQSFERSKSEAGKNLGKEDILGSRLLYLDVRRCHPSGKRIAFQ